MILGDRVFLQRLALLQALAIVPDRVVLVVEIGAQHHFGLVAEDDRLGRRRGHAAKIVDVLGDGQRVRQFLASVRLELRGDVHVRRALQHL